MPKKYIPVHLRSPQSVEKYNESMRLRRMKKRIQEGKLPMPKKSTPGAAKLLADYGLLDKVILPLSDQPDLTRKARKLFNERRRKTWRNVKF